MGRYSVNNIFGEARIYFCNYLIAYFPSHTIRLWYYRKIMKFIIMPGASIHLGCKFGCKGNFSIGENSTINQNCHLDNRGGLFIGLNVSISPKSSFITADHLMDSPNFDGRNRKIIIKDLVFIGYGSTILGGTILGKGCVISACSLVNKNTEDYWIYAGCPAKKVKERIKDLNYTTNYRRLFH